MTNEIGELKDIGINGQLINQIVKDLMLGHEVSSEDFDNVVEMMNTYTSLIINADDYKQIKIPHIMKGRLPYDRYKAINYALSVMPFHQEKSVFEYYAKKKESKKRFDKMSTLQWCMEILKAINFKESNEVFDIPFEYDLSKEEDRNKILDYFQNGNDNDNDSVQNESNDESPKTKKKMLKNNLKETMNLLISLIREKKTEITLSSIVVPSRLSPKRRKTTKNKQNQNDNDINNENIDDEFEKSINEYHF